MKPDPGSHLRDVDRTAAEIVDFVAGTDLDGFLGNRVLRRAVERDLEIIGEALNRLERDFPNVAARLPDLPKVVGLRNRIAHGYDAVVPETVWNAAVNHLPGLRRSVRSLLAELDRGVPAPDPRHADAVLVLSCAVSERVDSASPVHRDTLPAEIEEILRASERAGDVSRDETGTLARRIARARAETDLRVAAAREVDEGEHFEIKARFEGDPGYAEKDLRDLYAAFVAGGTSRLKREPPRPSEMERRVARAVIASQGTERHVLALAMAEALKRGTVPGADGIRKEREAVVAHLRTGTDGTGSYGERTLLRRVYRNFTGAEIREMSEGRGALLEQLPDDAARTRVRETLVRLHRDTSCPEPSPWRARHDSVARAAGLDVDLGRGRGRGLGAEIDI